jgi:hypothetical protein
MNKAMSSLDTTTEVNDKGESTTFIDTSIANYEKLYEAIGKQKSL